MNARTPRVPGPGASLTVFGVLPALLAACTSFSGLEPPGGGGHTHDGEHVPLAVSETCAGDVPVAEAGHANRDLHTDGLRDDFSMFTTCGLETPLDGRDGFFAIEASAGDRWHVMARPTEDDQDVSVYFLQSCDERSCQKAQNRCGAGVSEHSNFVTESAGRYFVGVESSTDAPVSMLIVKPPCGNGEPNHGETCDDGNGMSGDGCDPQCRAELHEPRAVEMEPNDDVVEANVVHLGDDELGTVELEGTLGGPCDVDRYALHVHDGVDVEATLLDPTGSPCGDGMPEVNMSLFEAGEVGNELGRGSKGGAGGDCPSIEKASFASNLREGEYHIAVSAPPDTDLFEYVLLVSVSEPEEGS